MCDSAEYVKGNAKESCISQETKENSQYPITMSLEDIAGLLDDVLFVHCPESTATDVCCDSRKAKPGNLFVCISGFQTDGKKYIGQALAGGCVALLLEGEDTLSGDEKLSKVPRICVKDARKALAVLSAEFLGRPAQGFLNVGITGTNGKTTTSYLIEAVLKAKDYNPGLLGTIEAKVAGKTLPLANTTPESRDLHLMFRQMADAGQNAVVMEVSSHALALNRTYGIPYDIAVFTNLTQDHLDFHQNMENYFQAKAKLFSSLGTFSKRPYGPFAVINLDDPYGKRLWELIKDRVPVITYGTNLQADVRAYNVEAGPDGLSYTLETRLGSAQVDLLMSGMFNLHNSLAAAAVGVALRLQLTNIVDALESVNAVPGRFQLIRGGQNFTVIVDYAHTPDGLENLLTSARGITSGKLSVVFGCGGDRDKTKRPIMGRIAAELADKVFVTTDNPRSEDPDFIVKQILEGITEGIEKVQVVLDRKKAIQEAVGQAKPGDTVVIAGKGHENYQKFHDKTIHFDDVEEAEKAVKKVTPREKAGLLVQPRMRLPIAWDRTAWNKDEYKLSLNVRGA